MRVFRTILLLKESFKLAVLSLRANKPRTFLTLLLSLLINAYSPLPAYIRIWAIFLGLIASAGVGVVFGVFPAWKAANLNPIEALPFE